MSISVELDRLPDVARGRLGHPFLLTVAGEQPRPISVRPVWEPPVVLCEAGEKTCERLQSAPTVTLLWPSDDKDPMHALIVDGQAEVDGTTLRITPTAAILHAIR